MANSIFGSSEQEYYAQQGYWARASDEELRRRIQNERMAMEQRALMDEAMRMHQGALAQGSLSGFGNVLVHGGNTQKPIKPVVKDPELPSKVLLCL